MYEAIRKILEKIKFVVEHELLRVSLGNMATKVQKQRNVATRLSVLNRRL